MQVPASSPEAQTWVAVSSEMADRAHVSALVVLDGMDVGWPAFGDCLSKREPGGVAVGFCELFSALGIIDDHALAGGVADNAVRAMIESQGEPG